MLETGALSRLEHVGNFASYCRCVESKRLSNDKKKCTNNKKNGNKYLSRAAYYVMRDRAPFKRELLFQ
jgi:hypothetical protein